MKRRQFLTKTSAAVVGTAVSARRVLGANDRVNVALVGCGTRGRQLAGLVKETPGAAVTVLCDVYDPQVEQARGAAGVGARSFKDFRRALEDKDVDAVVVATPDHWHGLIAVQACQAGKDVYVEKPLAHNVREGRAIVDAAKRFDRVVQHGTQHRTAPHYREVQQIVQGGQLGEVRFVRIWNYQNLYPHGIGREPDSTPPAGLDWDLYLGPAPTVPFNRARFLSTYRWFWDYAGGWVTDYGTHRFDSFHQVMGVDAPRSVVAAGGRFGLKDSGETPDLVQATYEYPGFIMSYEVCALNGQGAGGRTPEMAYYQMRGEFDRPHGEAYYGTSGTLVADRIGFEIYPEMEPRERRGGREAAPEKAVYRAERKVVKSRDTTDLLVKDFVESVKSRKAPLASAEIGHRSTIVPHLGNIAYRTGRKLRWNADKEAFEGQEPEATALLGRQHRAPWTLA
ncbi:MAG TPA: Gfo/Idh/MocA family oxidoreductase [Vicinamibacteria bacterium]|nr:Gfo/Idh/MocA family oxidoreductase [Vicinamibacteria bacterium]